MASEKKSIQPVWGLARRNLSNSMLDTAETLVENLDDISDVLDKLTEKYDKETSTATKFVIDEDEDENNENEEDENANNAKTKTEEQDANSDSEDDQSHARLFLRLKTGLDAARRLIDCLRSEKKRVMKRELSVECRIGEIEDYKEHMKHDMASLNETIDLLSVRILQLEDQLVDQQEQMETLEAENLKMKEKLEVYERAVSDLKHDNDLLLEDTFTLRRERTNTSMMLENKELLFKIEMLMVENSKLKEMVRSYNEDDLHSLSSEGDLGQSKGDNQNITNNNFQYSTPYSTTSGDESDTS